MSEYAIDGAGRIARDFSGAPVDELPKMNIGLVEECIAWAEFESGRNGKPVWNQGDWGTDLSEMSPENREAWLHSLWSRDVGSSNVSALSENGVFSAEQARNYCGSAFCMAGYAAQVTGNVYKADYSHIYYPAKEIVGYNETVAGDLDWQKAGAVILGLTYTEAHMFFDGTNNLDLLKLHATNFAKVRGQEIHFATGAVAA